MLHGCEQRRQATNTLHCGVKIQQSVTPIMAARHGPFVGRQLSGLKRSPQWVDPGRWDCAPQKQKAIVVQTPSIFSVQAADLRVR
jgi:hypothetical protein